MIAHNAIPLRIRGVDYPSIGHAAASLGVGRTTLTRYLDNGNVGDFLPIQKDRRKGQRAVKCSETGREWPSASACAEAIGVTVTTVSTRARKGAVLTYINRSWE